MRIFCNWFRENIRTKLVYLKKRDLNEQSQGKLQGACPAHSSMHHDIQKQLDNIWLRYSLDGWGGRVKVKMNLEYFIL